MKKPYLLTTAFAVLLIGAGCTATPYEKQSNDTTSTDKTDTMNTPVKKSDSMMTDDATVMHDSSDELKLSAKEMGNRLVKFEWNVGDELLQKTEGWRLFYDRQKNPSEPAIWWWERGKTYREHEWKDLPEGEGHVRACAVVDDTCAVYSNDVLIHVE